MSSHSMIVALFLLVPCQVEKQRSIGRSCLFDDQLTAHCIYLSSNGKKLIVAGGSRKGGDWKVFDLTNGKCLLDGLDGTIRCGAANAVCLSQDSSLMAISGGTRLFLVDSATGKLRWDLTNEGYNPSRLGDIGDVCITPDNKYLISVLGGDKMIRVWDIRNKKPRAVFQFVEEELNAADRRTVERGEKAKDFYYIVGKCKNLYRCALAPDRKTMAVAGHFESKVPLLDLTTGKVMRTINLKQPIAVSLVFTSDGKWLVVGGHQEGMIEIWDVEKKQLVNSFGKHESGVEHIAISPDKKTIVSGGSIDGFRVWDVTTGQQKFSYFTKEDPRMPRVKVNIEDASRFVQKETRAAGCAFLPDGKTFLIVPHWTLWNTEIYFHDTATGRPVDFRERVKALPAPTTRKR